ncbi:MAG TPA: hypothetical protein VFV79_03505 [Saprospiraceae bacterium]|nr:hypothetical protein [Saprospiraceae bacterium]
MKPPLTSLSTLFVLILLICSSSCHDDVNCVDGDYLYLRYMHNGQNAIFGDLAIVERDSISFSTLDGDLLPENLSFVDSTMAIRLLLHPNYTPYLLRFGKQRNDTFDVPQWLFPLGRDCSVFIIEVAELNGEVICDLDCGDIIDVMF